MHKINFVLRVLASVFAVLVITNPAMASEKPEIFVQMGHTNFVQSVAFSPDGQYALSGSSDSTVKLWDVSTGREVKTLTGHSNKVNSVAFSPDGRYIVSGSWDKTVRLWEVATGRQIRTLTGHTENVKSVAFSPDGRYIASGSTDRTVKILDVSTGRTLRTFIIGDGVIHSVTFSRDGKYVFSTNECSSEGLKTWEIRTGKEIKTFKNMVGVDFYAIAISPDGKTALTGNRDRSSIFGSHSLRLWDLSTGSELRRMGGM